MSLSEATAQFTVDLLRQVGTPDSDVFLSPVSIAVALAMTYVGADGNTAKQMKECLFRGLTDDSVIHSGFGEIVKSLKQPSDAYQLSTANRLYCQKDFEILNQFLTTVTSHYQSDVQSVDFANDTENARIGINRWVEEITRNKIKDLITPGVLDALTRLVIVNAIYFKGDWKHKFHEKATIKKTFYSSPTRETKVDMMRQTKEFLYGETDSVQVLGMPYKADLAMFVLLPKERFGLADFEKQLSGPKLLTLIRDTREMEVIVEMPKFRLEQSFSLKNALQQLGMGDMFDEQRADFSGITGAKDLFVSAVIHKAFIEVNEEGSEAAAATAVMMNFCSAMPDPVKPPEFVADHPFIFAIIDMRNQAVLFIGKTVSFS